MIDGQDHVPLGSQSVIKHRVESLFSNQTVREDDWSHFGLATGELGGDVSTLSDWEPDRGVVAPHDEAGQPADLENWPKHFRHGIHSLFWVAEPVAVVARLFLIDWVKDRCFQLLACHFEVTDSHCERGFTVRVAVNS